MSDLGTAEGVQTDPGAEVSHSAENAPEQTENAGETTVQSEQTDNTGEKLGPDNLPPELEETRKQLLRDYHDKTQKLSAEKRNMAEALERANGDTDTLQKLLLQPWFKRAAEEERSRRNGSFQEPEMTDEQFELARTDKGAFQKLVLSLADKLVSQKISPNIENTNQVLSEMKLEKEFEEVANNPKFKDFRKLNDEGALDSYLDKGYDFAAAYKQYKFDNPSNETDASVTKRAEELIQKKSDGAVGINGVPRVKGDQVLYASNFEDAFDQAWKAVSRGQKDFVVERKKK